MTRKAAMGPFRKRQRLRQGDDTIMLTQLTYDIATLSRRRWLAATR